MHELTPAWWWRINKEAALKEWWRPAQGPTPVGPHSLEEAA